MPLKQLLPQKKWPWMENFQGKYTDSVRQKPISVPTYSFSPYSFSKQKPLGFSWRLYILQPCSNLGVAMQASRMGSEVVSSHPLKDEAIWVRFLLSSLRLECQPGPLRGQYLRRWWSDTLKDPDQPWALEVLSKSWLFPLDCYIE